MSDDTQLDAIYTAVSSLADEIAEMIADWFGRSVIEADHDLALAILARLVMPSRDYLSDPADEIDLLRMENNALRRACGLPANHNPPPKSAETLINARCGQLSVHAPHTVTHGPDQPRNCPGVHLPEEGPVLR